jgi:hypothetical protein
MENGIDFSVAMKEQVEEVVTGEVLARVQKFEIEPCKARFEELYRERITEMKQIVDTVEVKDPDSDKVVVQLATSAKGLASKVSDNMKQILSADEIQLVLNYVGGVKAIAKMFVADFEGIERTARKKHADYQYVLELERRKLEKKQQEEAARIQKKLNEDAAKNKVTAPILPTPSVSKEQPVVRTETGSASIRTEWVFKLPHLDVKLLVSLIPPKYWKVQFDPDYDRKTPLLPSIELDSALIRADIKSGVMQIPGIEIYERPITVLRKA